LFDEAIKVYRIVSRSGGNFQHDIITEEVFGKENLRNKILQCIFDKWNPA